MAKMKDAGIPTMVYYPRPMHGQTAYKDMECTEYPVTVNSCNCVMSLPMHPYLTEEIIDTVCNALIEALA